MVLDASAILALLQDEPGGEIVRRHLRGAVASAVNIAEVASRLSDRDVTIEESREAIDNLGIEIVPLNSDQAYASAAIRTRTRKARLSLGDRICLTLSTSRGLPALTADRRWSAVDVGVKVIQIRGA